MPRPSSAWNHHSHTSGDTRTLKHTLSHTHTCAHKMFVFVVAVVVLVAAAAAAATGLLLVHLDRVALLHFQGGGRVVFIDRRAIEPEPHHLHGETLHTQTTRNGNKSELAHAATTCQMFFSSSWQTYRPVAVRVHQLAQRRVLLDFELHDSVVLSKHLQVDVLRLGGAL